MKKSMKKRRVLLRKMRPCILKGGDLGMPIQKASCSYIYGVIHFGGVLVFFKAVPAYSYPSESFGVAFHLSLGSWKQAAVSLASKNHGKVQIQLGKNPGRSCSFSGLAAYLWGWIYRGRQKGAPIKSSWQKKKKSLKFIFFLIESFWT